MATVTCVGKYRDKQDRIYGYKLMDKNGQCKDVKPNSLKKAIAKKRLTVTNLTLTSDGRLVDTGKKKIESIHLWGNPSPFAINRIYGFKASYDTDDMTLKTVSRGKTGSQVKNKAPQVKNTVSKGYAELCNKLIQAINCTKALRFKSNIDFNKAKHIANIKGLAYHKINSDFAIMQNNRYIYLVSDKQIRLGNTDEFNLLFAGTDFTSIRFNGVDSYNTKHMACMFSNCAAKYLDLSTLDTSNVEDMHKMFENCKADVIDISSLNTSKVKNMLYMFFNCKARIIGLDKIDTRNVTDMQYMFCSYEGKYLDLRNFNTGKVIYMRDMFKNCTVKNLDLSSFTATSVEGISEMFMDCKAERIDLRNFRIADITKVEAYDVFVRCNARVTARDESLLNAVINAKDYAVHYSD